MSLKSEVLCIHNSHTRTGRKPVGQFVMASWNPSTDVVLPACAYPHFCLRAARKQADRRIGACAPLKMENRKRG